LECQIWLSFFSIITLVIKQLKMLNIRLQQLSRVDNLTGVANQLAFNECRQQEVPRPQGWAAHDRGLCRSRPFQTVNDSFGHGVVNVLEWRAHKHVHSHPTHKYSCADRTMYLVKASGSNGIKCKELAA
jgi:GGDEF domain-containing protein